ncbi:MAG TPA: J domain-containing protein [Actinomycetes bacterium]|nr:J domain-containing protein [Actinomycetes bacterium]
MNTIPGVTFRPIDRWPGSMTRPWERRVGRQFSAPWTSTLDLLALELRQLKAEDIVLQLDLTERDIRQDGLPRANARPPGHPGVILSFTSRHGALQFACDTYTWWETNMRVIALTLQALRAAARYGVVKTDEQYRGWAQLPPPAPPDGRMTPEQAARIVAEGADNPDAWEDILENLMGIRQAYYHDAARRLHPDAGGSHEAFTRIQAAMRVLDQHARSHT